MSEETLVHVARLQNGSAPPEAIWLDLRAMRFLIVAVPHDDAEATAVPVEEYLAEHPDRADVVRSALLSRLSGPPVIPGGGAAFLARQKRVDPEALVRAVTPENCHPETATGPAIGNEVW